MLKDKRFFSHTKNRAAVKYLVTLAIFSPHVVFIDGPFPAGQFNDIMAFRSCLKDKIKEGKQVIVDGGFPPNQQSTTELDMLITKTGILEQGLRELQIACPLLTGAVQQLAQVL
jgi:16S rRNA G966 N2-methylase RsmD